VTIPFAGGLKQHRTIRPLMKVFSFDRQTDEDVVTVNVSWKISLNFD